MNARILLPLTAAALVAASVSAASISTSHQHDAPSAATRIVDLPTITVRPAAEDLAYYQANKVVDLAAVTVRPQPEDRAYFLAMRDTRIVDLPVVTVRAELDEVQVAEVDAMRVNQIATR